MDKFNFPQEVFDNARTFAEVIGITLKGKIIEIYLGDTFEQIERTDGTENINGVIVGEVVNAFKDCLLINSFFIDDDDRTIKDGNLVYINGYNIKAICSIDSNGTFNDVFKNIKFAKKLKK